MHLIWRCELIRSGKSVPVHFRHGYITHRPAGSQITVACLARSSQVWTNGVSFIADLPKQIYCVWKTGFVWTFLSLLSSVEALIMCVVVEFAGYITNCSVFLCRVHFHEAVMHSKFTGHQQNRLKTVALMMRRNINICITGWTVCVL